MDNQEILRRLTALERTVRTLEVKKREIPTANSLKSGELAIYGGKIYVNDEGTVRSFSADV